MKAYFLEPNISRKILFGEHIINSKAGTSHQKVFLLVE